MLKLAGLGGLFAAAGNLYLLLMLAGVLWMTSPLANATSGPDTKAGATSKDSPAPFNPANCKSGDKRYVYWAAKNQVFRFKFDPKKPLFPRGGWDFNPAHAEVPPAPNPSEPEGCYGNPLRAGGVPYMEAFAAEQFQKLTGRKMFNGTAGIHAFAAVPDYRRGSNRSAASWSGFQTSKDCWQRAQGFYECLVSKGTDRKDYQINRALKIDKALLPRHNEVGDLYFSVNSDPASGNPENGFAAESGFELFGNVLVASAFRIFPNEIGQLIPYHRSLISYILDAHISGYQWTPQQPQIIDKKAKTK